jgi:hypothetical protein
LAVGSWHHGEQAAFRLLPSAFCLLVPAICYCQLPTPPPKATNLKTHCIKGNDDRHFELTVTKIKK